MMKVYFCSISILLLFLSGSIGAVPERSEWEALAKKGDVKSMVSMGVVYHTGDGVEQDYGKAMDWYLKAYAKGDGDAVNNIGVLFRDGLGVPKNEKVAYLLFLAVHMEGLGTEATQMRAGRSLSRLSGSLKEKEVLEALSYTWDYVDQIVESRGKKVKIGKDVLPTPKRPRIRDNNWWLDSEREGMTFESPAPWDKIGEEEDVEKKADVKSEPEEKAKSGEGVKGGAG